MLIISVDTSGRKGSIALCRGDVSRFEVLHLTSLEGGTYSAQLIPRIAEALQQNHLTKAEVEGFVVVSGPGSFTGLRVGLATVKGLCEVLQKPLAVLSMLEAVAITHGRVGGTATAVLDAGRGELYIGEYRLTDQHAEPVGECIAKLEAFAGETVDERGEILTPDAKVAEALRITFPGVRLVAPVLADQTGRLGLHKLLRGDTVDAAAIDVNYIRRSDAEIFSTPKP
jgi:tRNA threonylcarbamoyladenosine biosynthesis protein TsaB